MKELRDQLARDHRNHGCDTWTMHMQDCGWLLDVADAAEKVDNELRALGEANLPLPLASALLALQEALGVERVPRDRFGNVVKAAR